MGPVFRHFCRAALLVCALRLDVAAAGAPGGGEVPQGSLLRQALRGLGSKYFYERQAAVKELSGMGHGVMPHILKAVKSPDHFTRMSALEVLGAVARRGDEAALGEMVRASRYVEARRGAARALGNLGGDLSAGYLQAGLYDEDATVRETCARWLGRLRWEAAAERVRALLRDESPRVRAAACKALGLMGDEPSRSEIVKLLGDRFPEARLAAIAALGRLGAEGAINLMDLALNAHNARERVEALRALGAGGGDAAAQTCAAVLVTAEDEEVVEAARSALAGMGESASKALAQVVSDGSIEKRAMAMRRAASVGAAAVRGLIHIVENDPYDRLRHEAAKHLRRITGQDFGYSYDGPEDKQRAAVEAWKQWRESHGR